MDGPESPTVNPSEPEQEQRVVDAILEQMKQPDAPKVVHPSFVRDTLLRVGMDVDAEGFIVREGSDERVEPYAFSKERFSSVSSPVEDPFKEYFVPESEADSIVVPKDDVHLTELCTVYEFADGEYHPVRDDMVMLRSMLRHTGMMFSSVCSWADSVEFLTDSDSPVVDVKVTGDNELSLWCLDCSYTGSPDTWVEENDGDFGTLRCPSCSCLWESEGIYVCTACQTKHRWEDIASDDDGEGSGVYWEPTCPDCNSGHEYLYSRDRRSTFEETIELHEAIEEADFPYEEESRQFEER